MIIVTNLQNIYEISYDTPTETPWSSIRMRKTFVNDVRDSKQGLLERWKYCHWPVKIPIQFTSFNFKYFLSFKIKNL